MDTKAVIAGTQMVIALIEKRSPEPYFTEGWRPADDVEIGWPNTDLQQSLLAFSHPDADVTRRVGRIASELGATGRGLPPNLDFDFLYINKM